MPVPGPSPDVPSLHTDHMPCIAVSYGVVERPVPPRCVQLAHEVAVEVCKRLFDDWGYEDRQAGRLVQVYSVNVPLVESAIEKANRKVCFTTLWRNTYGQLFIPTKRTVGGWKFGDDADQQEREAGETEDKRLRFSFAPDFHPVINPDPDLMEEGTDAWAFYHGYTSVTPLRAEYAGLTDSGSAFGSGTSTDRFWV